jgi:hypothetical protein
MEVSLATPLLATHLLKTPSEVDCKSLSCQLKKSPLFVQLLHTNYYKIVKQLKSFKIIIVAATCFGLHKPSSGSSQPVLRQSYNVDFGYMSLFEVIGIVAA